MVNIPTLYADWKSIHSQTQIHKTTFNNVFWCIFWATAREMCVKNGKILGTPPHKLCKKCDLIKVIFAFLEKKGCIHAGAHKPD